jgi:predicted lipid-binding transport protein (Tim44 family)
MGKGGGNDGGVVAVKRYLIKEKKEDRGGAEKAKAHQQQKARLCSMTYNPLEEPVVADELGYLYTKEAVLTYLLNKRPMPSFSHIRSLKKDVVTLKLTPNTQTSKYVSADSAGDPPAPFMCPVTMAEGNGLIPFVAMKPCGCVLALEALEQLSAAANRSSGEPAAEGKAAEESKTESKSDAPASTVTTPVKSLACPLCHAPATPDPGAASGLPSCARVCGYEVIRLWPSDEETEQLREYVTQKRTAEAASKAAVAGVKRAREVAEGSTEAAAKPAKTVAAGPVETVRTSAAPQAVSEANNTIAANKAKSAVYAALFKKPEVSAADLAKVAHKW